MSNGTSADDWARAEFGHAELGDTRRTARLVRMAAAAARQPAGRVTQVFGTSADRQGAYDLLSNPLVSTVGLLDAARLATAERCKEESFVHVAVDGTSVAVTDRHGVKDFGAIGATNLRARGPKLVHSYAVRDDGVPLGVLDQQWWSRIPWKKRNDRDRRPLEKKETLHWVRTIERAASELTKVGVKGWFQLDREGDRYWTLKALRDSGQWLTVRSTYAHRFVVTKGPRRTVRLRDVVGGARPRFTVQLEVRGSWKRQARHARLRIRTASVVLDMVEAHGGERLELPLYVVDVREEGTTPSGEPPIHWRLLTNRRVSTRADALAAVNGYAMRWRIEELHRAWKSGVCRIEDAQLRSAEPLKKWAIIMITVAARIERLKALARSSPEMPACTELSVHELKAICVLRRREGPSTDDIDVATITLDEAVRWIADLGGYVGHKSSGPPGATTLKRGLALVAPVAFALQCLESDGKLR